MARRLWLGCALVAILSAFPAHADVSQITAGCAGYAPAGGAGSCSTQFQLPHFDGRDEIDYASLVARFVSPLAGDWRVEGKIQDARGVVYFSWYCDVGRSVVFGSTSFYLARSCEGTRRTISGLPGTPFYIADVNRLHRMTITASVGTCVPASLAGCRFEGAATYLIAG
jgi:hypothetical protein